ncbi:hypothetical protein EVAR_72546_1 [Eumeta japonica]|uniref:Uncharacterized protein n=1 Tax=Eumeta variegata TaxID=151549 RepID=A0A4C1TA58_EUMVA|nr:hypothetical protein EVAR_72546_1 [Eumeta japonica]
MTYFRYTTEPIRNRTPASEDHLAPPHNRPTGGSPRLRSAAVAWREKVNCTPSLVFKSSFYSRHLIYSDSQGPCLSIEEVRTRASAQVITRYSFVECPKCYLLHCHVMSKK